MKRTESLPSSGAPPPSRVGRGRSSSSSSPSDGSSSSLVVGGEATGMATTNNTKQLNHEVASIRNVSSMKLMAATQRRKLQDKKLKKVLSLRLPATLEVSEDSADDHNAAAAAAVAKATAIHAIKPKEEHKDDKKQSIVAFETSDAKWKAMIRGDLEKFMYPSLRLESLYDTAVTAATSAAAATCGWETPSLAEVDAVMAATTKVHWEVEKRFQNTTQSSPANGHLRVQDANEQKRLHFDTQLEAAEGLLRKKDLQLLDAKRQQGLVSAIGSPSSSSSKYRTGNRNTSGSTTHDANAVASIALAAVVVGRERGASLYRPDIVKNPQLIPRLPHTRKIIKEIQRHTSNDGQIQYYADKHNLFTKWKKLQVTELHNQPPNLHHNHQPLRTRRPREDKHLHDNSDSDSDSEQDSDCDPTTQSDQPLAALSPRSLFYHECTKHQILPEPIFSRIHEVPIPSAKQLLPSLALRRKTFGAVVAKLVQGVHAKHAKHEDLVPTADGKYAAKKHHLALHLQHFGLGDLKMDALSKSLSHFQSIHVLDLSSNRLTDKSIIQLLQCLENASSSSSSSSGSSAVRPASSSASAATASTGSSTTSPRNVITSSTSTSRTGPVALPTPVPTSRRRGNDLRVLNLSQNDLGIAGCAQIARFLGICTQLTHLDLSHAKITSSQAVAPLTSAIETHRSLQVVNLSYNAIGSACACLLGDMLTQPSCSVTQLDLSWNQIGQQGAIAIGKSLGTNTMLVKLNLAMNRFADEGAEQLALALEANQRLVELDLSRNNLGGKSAIAFAFFLRQNTVLRHLWLNDNRIGATGAKALLRTVSLGSKCEFHVLAHDVESLNGVEKDPIFDFTLPSMLSPFTLRLGSTCPYEYAVVCELIECMFVHKTCLLMDVKVIDDTPKKPITNSLNVDLEKGVLVDATTGKRWKPSSSSSSINGIFTATACFQPAPIQVTSHLSEEACLSIIETIERGFSSREKASFLELAVADLYMTTLQADLFVKKLRGSLDLVEIIGRLWPCLVDGENCFSFLQTYLSSAEQRRLIDGFGMSVIQFSTKNPTGRWVLDLSDRGQRKIAIWFAMLNANEVFYANTTKRTDGSQFGKGYNWRNASYNRQPIQLSCAFYNKLPTSGVLEFDFVSTIRYEDLPNPTKWSDLELEKVLQEIGAEVFAIYIPLPKRRDLKYQLLLFHLAIADKFITSPQAHRVLQYFPKNYETCRFKIILAVHRMLIDLENFGEMLDRLVVTDRKKVYQALGYLNTINPLEVDRDFEVDFERDDEKVLLRALVDLSMSCPMDMIRIESEKSTVLVIYSMYQTNSVPSTGRMCFRYMSHPMPNKSEFLKVRSAIFKHFLCGERLRMYVENAAALPQSSGGGGTRGSVVAVTMPSTSLVPPLPVGGQ